MIVDILLDSVSTAACIRYDHPATYPDAWTDLPLWVAARCAIFFAPYSLVEAARFRSYVHIGPDVTLPIHHAMHISAGMKFMLFIPANEDVIKSAWHDFKDRLRWRLKFDMQEANSNKDEESRDQYDPDYEVPHDRVAARTTYEYIELGLSAGDAYVAQYCGDIVPQIKTKASNSGLVWLTDVRDFLHKNGYIVLGTDKNLGSCVVTRTWFIENTQLLLSDKPRIEKSIRRSDN